MKANILKYRDFELIITAVNNLEGNMRNDLCIIFNLYNFLQNEIQNQIHTKI